MDEASNIEEPGDTFVIRIPANESYRPELRSLKATRDYYRQRLVDSGKLNRRTGITGVEHAVLSLLLRLVNTKHWKATGELFAFPDPKRIDRSLNLSDKMGLRAIRGLKKHGLVVGARRCIERGVSTYGYVLRWPPNADSDEWTQTFGREKNSRARSNEPAGPTLFDESNRPHEVGAIPPTGGRHSTMPVETIPPEVGAVPPNGGRTSTEHNNEHARGSIELKELNKQQQMRAGAEVTRECEKPVGAAAADLVQEIQSLGVDGPTAAKHVCDRRTLEAIRTGIRVRKPKHPDRFAAACLRDPAGHINPAWYPDARSKIAGAKPASGGAPTWGTQRAALEKAFLERDIEVIGGAPDEIVAAALAQLCAHPPMGWTPDNWRSATPASLRANAASTPALTQLVADRIRGHAKAEGGGQTS